MIQVNIYFKRMHDFISTIREKYMDNQIIDKKLID